MNLKKAKIYSKKSLSIFLAVVMLLTTCSVAFGLTATAATTSVLKELADALECQTVLDLMDTSVSSSSYSAYTTSSSTSDEYTKLNRTVTFENYSDYAVFLNLVSLVMSEVDYLILNNGKGGYGSGIGSSSFDNENAYSVYTQLCLTLAKEMGSSYYAYDVAGLINIIFCSWSSDVIALGEAMEQKAYGDKTWGFSLSNYDDGQYAWLYYNLTVTTTDVVGWLSYADNNNLDYDSMTLQETYTVTMHRISYSTGTVFKSYYRAWTFENNSYIPTTPTTTSATSNATTFIAEADDYGAYMADIYAQYPTFDEVYDLATTNPTGFSALYAEIIATQADMIDKVADGDSTNSDELSIIASLYADGSAYEDCIDNFTMCDDLEVYTSAAAGWAEFAAANTDYGVYDGLGFGVDGEDLIKDYQTFTTNYYSILEKATAEGKATMYEMYDLDIDYYTNFGDNVNAYKAAEIKVSLDALVKTYEFVDVTTLESAEQQAVYSAVYSYLNTVEGYSAQVQEDDHVLLFADDYQAYYDLLSRFECEINSYVLYFTEMYFADYDEYSTADLLTVLADYDTDCAGLTKFYDKVAAATSTDLADELLGTVIGYADALEAKVQDYLADRFEGQVYYAYEVYKLLLAAYDDGSLDAEDMTPAIYSTLKMSIGEIETDIYDKLSKDGVYTTYVDELAQENYEDLANIISVYTVYASSIGFEDYTAETIEYDDREVYEDIDEVKTEDYEVDEDDMETIIAVFDDLLTDPDVLLLLADVLGLDVSDYDEFNLYEVVIGLIEDMLFSDSIVNMVMYYIYPMVGEYFVIDLPTTYDYSGIDVAIDYNFDTLADLVYDEGNLAITPYYAASAMGNSQFPDVYTALVEADDNWYASSIYDGFEDAFAFNWGIDDAKASNEAGKTDIDVYDLFVNAMGSALEGLYPFLAALLLGQEWDDIDTHSIGTATALYVVPLDITLTLGATANDGYVNALGAIYEVLGYYGYHTAEWISNTSNIGNATDMVDMLFTDIYALLENLLEEPITNIINALPSLIYTLMCDVVQDLLRLIYTCVEYSAAADIAGDVMADTIPVDIGDMINLADMGLDLSGGLSGLLEMFGIELYNFNEGLLASLGTVSSTTVTNRNWFVYDTSTYNATSGVLESVVSALPSGTCYSIEANTGDVLYYVLTYIVDSLKNGSLYDLLGAFLDEDTIAMVEEYVSYTGIADETIDSGDIVAALVELFLPVYNYGVDEDGEVIRYDEYFTMPAITDTHVDTEYTTADDETITVPYGYYYDESTGLFMPVEDTDESIYTEYWTEETADFVTDDLVNYISETATLFGLDETATELISTTVDDLLGSFVTNDMLDTILGYIQPLVQEYAIDDPTYSMIIELAGPFIDTVDVAGIIDHILTFEYEAIEDGDVEAFTQVLIELLEPLVPILDFVLVSYLDGEYVEVLDEDGNLVDEWVGSSISLYDGAISLLGYNGYESALIPLLEALGCDSAYMLSYEDYLEADNETKLHAILDPILGLITDYVTNSEDEYAIYGLFDLIPNILYFVQYGGLNEVIDNILTPVYAALDTIRPIYNVTITFAGYNFTALISDLVNELIASADIENYAEIEIDISEILTNFLYYGYTEERESITGNTYNYFVLYEENYSEIVTVVLYSALENVVFGEDIQQYIDLLGSFGSILGEDSEIGTLLVGLSEMESVDQIMFALYYVVYGLDAGSEYYDLVNDTMLNFFTDVIGLESSAYTDIIDRTSDLLDALKDLFNDWEDVDVESGEESSAESTLNWFEQILADIKAFFENLFSWLSF